MTEKISYLKMTTSFLRMFSPPDTGIPFAEHHQAGNHLTYLQRGIILTINQASSDSSSVTEQWSGSEGSNCRGTESLDGSTYELLAGWKVRFSLQMAM